MLFAVDNLPDDAPDLSASVSITNVMESITLVIDTLARGSAS